MIFKSKYNLYFKAKMRVFAWILVGFLLNLVLDTLFYVPPAAEFLKTTTENYFKYMSDNKNVMYSSYYDCRIEEPSDEERKISARKMGVCRYELNGKKLIYTIGLSVKAKFLFAEE